MIVTQLSYVEKMAQTNEKNVEKKKKNQAVKEEKVTKTSAKKENKKTTTKKATSTAKAADAKVTKKATTKKTTSTDKAADAKVTKKATTKKTTSTAKAADAKVTKKATTKKATSTAKAADAKVTKKATTKKTTSTAKAADAKVTKKTTTKKATSTAKAADSKVTKKATTKKTTSTAKVTKKATTKKTTSTAKATDAKVTKKATTKKASSTSETVVIASPEKVTKARITKTATKKASSKKTAIAENIKDVNDFKKINPDAIPAEYYDLPYHYDKTTVKILAQTPHSMFLYWDVSDADKAKLEEKYGKTVFVETQPVLIIHNVTQNYTFEINVDDFSNSWYVRTPTSNCQFNVELARKKINGNYLKNNNSTAEKIHISSSNTVISPNDHILSNTINNPVLFKNVKTNSLEELTIHNLSKIEKLYQNYELDNSITQNPSSNFRI